MSTIASPREASVTSGRRIPLISTPTSSSRPSLEVSRSTEASPSLHSNNTFPSSGPPTLQPKRNRAALREYYNLKTTLASAGPPSTTSTSAHPPPASDTTSDTASIHDYNPSSPLSELNSADFRADEYVKRVLETEDLAGLLGVYQRVMSEMRALDAERKALVYDNYSKLIVATETIGRMRGGMGARQGAGEGNGLDERVEEVWRRVGELRAAGFGTEMGNDGQGKEEVDKETGRRRVKGVVEKVLDCPARVRELVEAGDLDEARREWEATSIVLNRWKERGVGGSDVVDCLEDGDAALRGEAAGDKSWVNIKKKMEVQS